MAYSGLVIENPLQRDRVEFVQTRESTGGELLEAILTFDPEGSVSEEHLHPIHEESFEVLAGRLGVRVDGAEGVLGPGDSRVVAPGARHRIWNGGDRACEVRLVVRPALYFEELLEIIYGLDRDGLLAKRDLKTLLRWVAFMRGKCRDHIFMAKPPVWAQKLLIGSLGPIARLAGYPSDYPEYVVSKPES